MPSATAEETRETAQRAKSASARARSRSVDATEQIEDDVIPALVMSWTELVRMMLPPVVLRPEDALRALMSGIEQTMEMQRRAMEELLSAGQDVVIGSDLDRELIAAGNGSAGS